MTASFLDGKKGRSLDTIIAKLSKVRSSKTGDRILLISEKSNACLSLSSDESEDSEADLHQCGHCKEMFTSLSVYITHKIEKLCKLPSRPHNHVKENDVEAPEDMQESESPSASKRCKVENDSMQDSHKKKHDRKGMARKLNMAELETPVINENHLNEKDSHVVVVVGNDSEAERRYVHENEASVSGFRSHDRRELYSPRQRKEGGDLGPRNMPYLERIPNFAYESHKMFSHTGMPGYLPRASEKTVHDHEAEKDSVDRERIAQKAYGSERESHDSWHFANKPTRFHRGPNEVTGQYNPYVHSSLYNPQSSLSYHNSYHRYPNAVHSTEASQSCCSPAYAPHPHYPADLYTIPIEEYNKGLYNKEPPFKPPSEPETEAAHKEVSQGSPKKTVDSVGQHNHVTERSLDSIEQEHSSQTATEENDVKEGDDKALREVDATQHSPEMGRPPQLVKVCCPNSKEIEGSPYSSQRLDSNETNSHDGGSGGSTISSAESPMSSSNQSLDHVISPSQVYERANFVGGDEVSEDASKQSLEQESPFQSTSAAYDDAESPKSKHAASDAALRGSENVTPHDARPSFIRDKSHNSVEASTEHRGEAVKTDGSPTSDPSWRHSKQVYRCPLCAKIFPFKSKLQRHVLVHTGIKPYKCNVCGRGFTQQIDLQRHLTRHTGEKPFKCHLCKAQFIRADNLRKHAKDTHFVNIEEPIRKRRRKTTGSDTVLPPLEVAIAMAINETEKNGGRVLGRAGNRGNRGNARRERIASMEDDQRRAEQANNTFARPTMGSVSAHQYPVCPPSMGYPSHAPSMPPFPRISPEMHDPINHERGSPPSRLPANPQRYHPGSMVFQPRPDRYMEHPFFPRPPGDIPAMYWSSSQQHPLLSPNEIAQVSNRDRLKSEASEGASNVFEGRDDLGKYDVPNGPVPPDFRRNMLLVPRQGGYENDSERILPQDESHAAHRTFPPPHPPPTAHNDVFHHSPGGRLRYPSEHGSQYLSDDRPVHILDEGGRLDERGRFAQDRMRSVEESLRDNLPEIPSSSSEFRTHMEGANKVSKDDQVKQSSKRGSASSCSEGDSHGVNHSNENGDSSTIQGEATSSAGYAYSTDERLKKQSPENWKRYETSNLETAPNQSHDNHVSQKDENADEKLIDRRFIGGVNPMVHQVSE